MNTFILLPLYIYPLANRWDPLFNAAATHPNVTFQVVINPDSGPGGASCPTTDYITALTTLAQYPNVQTLGYVHTANRYDCGPENDWICPCTAPLADVQANVTDYAGWASCGDGAASLAVDGIFMDEAPEGPECVEYMTALTASTRAELAGGNDTVVFNAGVGVDAAYWGIADYINVFENSHEEYEKADIGALDCQGACSQQTTLIIYSHQGVEGTLRRDVDTVLNLERDAIAGLYISDFEGYTEFGRDWEEFVDEVDRVTELNRAFLGT